MTGSHFFSQLSEISCIYSFTLTCYLSPQFCFAYLILRQGCDQTCLFGFWMLMIFCFSHGSKSGLFCGVDKDISRGSSSCGLLQGTSKLSCCGPKRSSHGAIVWHTVSPKSHKNPTLSQQCIQALQDTKPRVTGDNRCQFHAINMKIHSAAGHLILA